MVTLGRRRLSLVARDHLRASLLDADLGISGANFLVADTGSLVIVENEGNIRYSTTTPPIHVALVGMDKLIPKMSDLATFLPLLTTSATGQRAFAYRDVYSSARDLLEAAEGDKAEFRAALERHFEAHRGAVRRAGEHRHPSLLAHQLAQDGLAPLHALFVAIVVLPGLVEHG